MKINVKDLEIATPSITVSVVKISGKQMTLAVFRQIDIGDLSEYILNPTKDIVIWGRVNYKTNHISDYKGDYIHTNWVNLKKTGLLYRDSIENIYNNLSTISYYENTIDAMIEALDNNYRIYQQKDIKKYTDLLDLINCGEGHVFLKIKDNYDNKHKDNPTNLCFDSIELAEDFFIKKLKKKKELVNNNNLLKDFLNIYRDLKQLFIAV